MNLSRFCSLPLLLSLVAAFSAQKVSAASAWDPGAYYELGDPEVEVIMLPRSQFVDLPVSLPPLDPYPYSPYDSSYGYGSSYGNPNPDLGSRIRDTVSVARDIVNLGQTLWSIVEKNKPQVNLDPSIATEQFASALPAQASALADLENWKGPSIATVQLRWKNPFGWELAVLSYKVTFFHSATYKQHGQYIHAATVVPDRVSVGWGLELDAGVTVSAPMNFKTTEDPQAGLQMVVRYGLKTPFKQENGRKIHVLYGNGQIKTY